VSVLGMGLPNVDYVMVIPQDDPMAKLEGKTFTLAFVRDYFADDRFIMDVAAVKDACKIVELKEHEDTVR